MKYFLYALCLFGVFFVGYKLSSPTIGMPVVVYNPDKPYHDKFNTEVGNLLDKNCLPSFKTRIGSCLHGCYAFDTFVNRWKNKQGGYTYFVKSWADGEERQILDRKLGEIVPCKKLIRTNKWKQPEID